MPNLDRDFARRLSDHVHGIEALPMPTGLRLRLMTTNGDADTNGTEAVAGGGYGAGASAPLLEYAASTLATPTVAAAGPVTVGSWPRDEDLVGGEVWGLISGVQKRLYFGAFDTPISATTGAAVEIPDGDIQAMMS